jgi:hypothetical protein
MTHATKPVGRLEFELINKIANRAVALADVINMKIDKLTMLMDIENAHLTNPMDLNAFLAFDDANFGHDAFGIRRHMNRSSGKLMDCFRPRCSL